MKKADLESYTDYLISTFGQASATGLFAIMDGDVSHDRVPRFLSEREYTSKNLWLQVKTMVRTAEKDVGVLIFDDAIQEKKCTDENEIMRWHFDHLSNRSVRGMNLLNALYHNGGVSIPVAFGVVKKLLEFCDLKTRQRKRGSEERTDPRGPAVPADGQAREHG